MTEHNRRFDPRGPRSARARPEPPAVEHRALPTQQRMRRAGADFERGDTGQITMRDSPLERAYAHKLINHQIFAPDLGNYSGMAKTEAQVFHRQRYREATQAVGKIGSHVLEWAVCREIPLDQVGYTLGWGSRPQAYAAAVERMKTALDALCELWGLAR
jgi:hypothetical protein